MCWKRLSEKRSGSRISWRMDFCSTDPLDSWPGYLHQRLNSRLKYKLTNRFPTANCKLLQTTNSQYDISERMGDTVFHGLNHWSLQVIVRIISLVARNLDCREARATNQPALAARFLPLITSVKSDSTEVRACSFSSDCKGFCLPSSDNFRHFCRALAPFPKGFKV